jgi:diguanylate cyclase (GGDEF)-like protein
VSHRIRYGIRECDIAARIGGDEFVVVLASVDRVQAERRGESIAKAINEPILFDDCELFTDASFGTSLFPDDGTDTDTLLKIADEKMYLAKARGRVALQSGMTPTLSMPEA